MSCKQITYGVLADTALPVVARVYVARGQPVTAIGADDPASACHIAGMLAWQMRRRARGELGGRLAVGRISATERRPGNRQSCSGCCEAFSGSSHDRFQSLYLP